ncbi:hypothetical protein [Clostridium estertheticum]|uniref:Apea-like HEPN domain-containing protein n=1 Tax=Clostridium estertheticum TaxID=238834 RepID=A0AA47EN02_9CLOT|nr:hypothetical protein [Clostridium estertheticum]MBU3157590.1 hypothetical protein [Clostridium estertheticum]WAG63211.1 hypothetical protein LL038_25045 [Clostridium estertheticum]
MNIKFIGTGIKKGCEENYMCLIGENIKKCFKEVNSDLNIEFNYKYLSDRIGEIEDESEQILSMSSSFNNDNIILEVDIKKFSYEDNKINIFVTIDSKITGDECVLEEFIYDAKVNISMAVSKYTNEINWIRDEQNEKISECLYIKIHNLENKFRGIINEYMLKKFGEEWFSKKIVHEFTKKSEDFSKWYNNKYKTLIFIQSEMFNLQTNDLIQMLKNSYEDEVITKVMKQINVIKSLLREKTADVINEDVLNNKNLWEKYFIDIFDTDIELKWEEFAKMRNMIAHNKIISKEFYTDMLNLISELNNIFDNANRKLKSKMKSLEEQMINSYIKSCDLDWILESIDFKNYQDDEEVIEEIISKDGINSLYSITEEKIENLVELFEELKISLEDVYLELEEEEIDEIKTNDIVINFSQKLITMNSILNDRDADLIELLLNKTNNVAELNAIGNYLAVFKNDMIEKLEFWIENTSWNNEFKDNTCICNYYNLNNDIFNVKIIGWFCIDFGSSDEIFIIYKRNEDEIERGGIEISFGDYIEHDGGYVMPEQEQYIEANVGDLCSAIETDIDEIILSIRNCIDTIDSVN